MRIKKREDELKAQLFTEARTLPPSFYVLPIQDVRKSGTPDFTFHGYDATTWWEVKHATPHFDSQGIQEVICKRLARASYCRYVIYVDERVIWPTGAAHERFTVILNPIFVFGKKGRLDWALALEQADLIAPGFDHAAVVEFMRKLHMDTHSV